MFAVKVGYLVFINFYPFFFIYILLYKRLTLVNDSAGAGGDIIEATYFMHIPWPLNGAGLSSSTFYFLFTYTRNFLFLSARCL